jgi:O-antigen/teichoic acid export membrane protein
VPDDDSDEHGDDYTRDNESEAQRLDRNYGELLQELRVAQTGVQILFAFLLGIAFQTGFKSISEYQRDIYLATLVAAALAAIMLIAPTAVHRMLFRRHQKYELVTITSRLAAVGLVFLAIAILSAVLLVVSVVVNLVTAVVFVAVLGLVLIGTWYVLPSEVRRRRPSRDLRP